MIFGKEHQANKMTRIAVDAMGGDYAPREIVKGSAEAAQDHEVEVVLVGQEDLVREELARLGFEYMNIDIVPASEVIAMDEPPVEAVRKKKDSSIVVGMNLLKSNAVSAFISAGNTGATVTTALFVLGKEKGIKRPALAVAFSASSGPVLLLDVGANADCKPDFLVQFAQMGSAYMEKGLGLSSPRIGLLSNGEEDSKGNHLVREAHQGLKRSGLNFIGNIEGKDILKGAADVIVTDGFTGNVVIKVAEGLAEMPATSIEQVLTSLLPASVTNLVVKPAFQALIKRTMDYTEYGGAQLLGVKGNVLIAHGRSQAKAIKNAILRTKKMVEQGQMKIAPAGSRRILFWKRSGV